MKLIQTIVVCAVAMAPVGLAQRWEFGGGVGGGFYTTNDIASATGSVGAKIQTNIAGSAWFGNNGHGRWGGEVRYDYQRGDLQLNQGDTHANFGAETHGIHYDVLWHLAPSESAVRPFVALGAGVKLFRGTGTEVLFQPLSKFALLTKAQDVTPLISGGAGIKFNLTGHWQLRLEVHDFATPFPKKVITPNVGAKVSGGWLHDIVPMAGLVYVSN
jgi:hypothetical protein